MSKDDLKLYLLAIVLGASLVDAIATPSRNPTPQPATSEQTQDDADGEAAGVALGAIDDLVAASEKAGKPVDDEAVRAAYRSINETYGTCQDEPGKYGTPCGCGDAEGKK